MRNSSSENIRERSERGQGTNSKLASRVSSVEDCIDLEKRHRRAAWLRTHYPQLSTRNTYYIVEMASASDSLQVTLCEVVVRIGWIQFLLAIGCIMPDEFIELALVRRNMERVIIEAMIESKRIESRHRSNVSTIHSGKQFELSC